MIEKITLENFQGYKKSILDLDPGINVVVGNSDGGKTSIFRALLWVIFNRPGGVAFVSDWIKDEKDKITGQTRVKIEKKEGVLSRFKNKNDNGYSIEGHKFLAIGLDVQEKVNSFLNLNQMNLQEQHDGPFLLGETPGEIARFLNKLIDIEQMDVYLKIVESKKRKAVKIKKELTGSIDVLNSDLTSLDWVFPVKKLLEIATNLEFKIKTIQKQVESLEISIENYKKYVQILSDIIPIKEIEDKLKQLEKLNSEEKQTQTRVIILENSVKKYRRCKKELENNIPIEKIEDKLKRLTWYENKISELKINHENLNNTINSYGVNQYDIEQNKQIITDNYKLLPKMCPLCGGEMGEI